MFGRYGALVRNPSFGIGAGDGPERAGRHARQDPGRGQETGRKVSSCFEFHRFLRNIEMDAFDYSPLFLCIALNFHHCLDRF